MRYTDFYQYLTIKINTFQSEQSEVYIGPSIAVDVKTRKIMSSSQNVSTIGYYNPNLRMKRFIIFPVKIFGETIRHLNILILDRKTKIIERYEPFNTYLNFNQINDLIEPFLYKWMEERKIYFLKYQTTLNSDVIVNEKNCGIYCINYVVSKLKEARKTGMVYTVVE